MYILPYYSDYFIVSLNLNVSTVFRLEKIMIIIKKTFTLKVSYLKHLCYYFKLQAMTNWADPHSTYMAGFGQKQGQEAASPVGHDWPCLIFDAQLLL